MPSRTFNSEEFEIKINAQVFKGKTIDAFQKWLNTTDGETLTLKAKMEDLGQIEGQLKKLGDKNFYIPIEYKIADKALANLKDESKDIQKQIDSVQAPKDAFKGLMDQADTLDRQKDKGEELIKVLKQANDLYEMSDKVGTSGLIDESDLKRMDKYFDKYQEIQDYESKANIGDLQNKLASNNSLIEKQQKNLDNIISQGAQAGIDEFKRMQDEIQGSVNQKGKVSIFDGIKTQIYDVEKDADVLKKKLKEVVSAMDTPVTSSGNLRNRLTNSSEYYPGDSLKFLLNKETGTSPGTGTYFASNIEDVYGWGGAQHGRSFPRGVFATDLSKQGNLLKIPSEDAYNDLRSFFGNIHDFIAAGALDPKDTKRYDERLSKLGENQQEQLQEIYNRYNKDNGIIKQAGISYDQFADWMYDQADAFADFAEKRNYNLDKIKEDSVQTQSFGTKFLKDFLGVNGLDASYLDVDDSTAAGSLVYKLNKNAPLIDFGTNKEIIDYYNDLVKDRLATKKALNKNNDISFNLAHYFGNQENPEDLTDNQIKQLQELQKAKGIELNYDNLNKTTEEIKQMTDAQKEFNQAQDSQNTAKGYDNAQKSAREAAKAIEQATEAQEKYNKASRQTGNQSGQQDLADGTKAASGALDVESASLENLKNSANYAIRAKQNLKTAEFNLGNQTQSTTALLNAEAEALNNLAEDAQTAAKVKSEFVSAKGNTAEDPTMEQSTVVSDKAIQEAKENVEEEAKIAQKLKQVNNTSSTSEISEANEKTKQSAEQATDAQKKLNETIEQTKKSSSGTGKSVAEQKLRSTDFYTKVQKLQNSANKQLNKYLSRDIDVSQDENGAKLQSLVSRLNTQMNGTGINDRSAVLQRGNAQEILSLYNQIKATMSEINKQKALIDAPDSNLNNQFAKAEENAKDYQKLLSAINDEQKKAEKFTNGKFINGISSQGEKWTNTFDEMKSSLGSISKYGDISQISSKFAGAQIKFQKFFNAHYDDPFAKIVNNKSIPKLQKQISDFLASNPNLSAETVDYMENISKQLDSVFDKGGYDKLFNQFIDRQTQANNNGETGGTNLTKMLQNRVMSNAADVFAQFFSFYDIIRYTKEMAQNVTNVDSALIELAKVSDASNTRIQQSFQTSAQTAQQLGQSISDVISSTADWARLGYSVDDAEKLAKTTSLFQLVGDNMTQETASQAMISTLKAYKVAPDDAQKVVDKYNEVSTIIRSPFFLKCK